MQGMLCGVVFMIQLDESFWNVWIAAAASFTLI